MHKKKETELREPSENQAADAEALRGPAASPEFSRILLGTSFFPLILQGKSKLPLAADEAEMGVSGGIFIRIYPRLLGRPAAYLRGFNGNHSTFLRSRGRRHPGWRRDGFSGNGRVFLLSHSLRSYISRLFGRRSVAIHPRTRVG